MVKRILAAVACVMAMGAGIQVRGQFVDEGKNAVPQGIAQSVDLHPLRPDRREVLTRQLAQLQAERQEAAAHAGKEGVDLGAMDRQIATIRTQLGSTGVPQAEAGSDPQEGLVAAAMPMFPRIVQVAPEMPAGAGMPPPQTTGTPTTGQSFDGGREDDAARATLSQSQVTLVSENVSLEKMINSIRTQAKVNVEVNWKALEASGIDRNAPVTVNLNQVAGDKALDVVLKEVGGSTASLGFTTNEGVVTVSTRDDLNSARYQQIRVYNVNDLLAMPQGYVMPAQFAMEMSAMRVTNLQDIIRSVVSPDTWRDNGGQIGSIQTFDGMLVVNQTRDNHYQIERLLVMLRAARAGRN